MEYIKSPFELQYIWQKSNCRLCDLVVLCFPNIREDDIQRVVNISNQIYYDSDGDIKPPYTIYYFCESINNYLHNEYPCFYEKDIDSYEWIDYIKDQLTKEEC